MKLTEFKTETTNELDVYRLYACGDWHLGAKNCDEDLLDRTLKAIEKDPKGLFIGMGDAAECITPADPRWDARSISPKFLPELEDIAGAQFRSVKKKLSPLAKQGKIVGLLDGNHEENIRKRHYRHLTLDLCRELNVPYLSYSCMIRLGFRNKTLEGNKSCSRVYVVRALHGHTAGRKKGGQLNSMNDMVAHWDADIFLRGHSHRLVTDQSSRIRMTTQGEPKLVQDTKVYGVTGSYYRTYAEDTDCYAEIADYPPSELGCVVVNIAPFKRTVKEEGKHNPMRTGQISISVFVP